MPYYGYADVRSFRWQLVAQRSFMGWYTEVLAASADGGEAALSPTPEIGQWPLAMAYAMRGRPVEARQAFAGAIAFHRAQDNQHQVGWVVYYELLMVALTYHPERVAERRRLAAAGEAAWRRSARVQANLPARWVLPPLLLVEGEWAEARTLAQEPGGHALPFQREVAVSLLGPLARLQGDPDLAWDQVETMFPDGPETPPGGVSFPEALAVQRLGAALALDGGDTGTARAWLEAHDRFLGWSGAVIGAAEAQILWAEYHRATGDADAARADAERALVLAGAPRRPLALLAVYRMLGVLATDAGCFERAADHLDEALHLADVCVAPFARALTLLASAPLRARTGDHAAATALLDEARAICIPSTPNPPSHASMPSPHAPR
jgi:hypothetical protein